MKPIVVAGLTCGVLDGLCAIGITLSLGGRVIRLFQGITAGLLGSKSFQGGMETALAGVGLHFLIAFTAAAVYYAASRYFPVMVERALLCGVAFGIAVHFFMQLVVIRLSAIPPRPIVLYSFMLVALAHVFVVGPSIALTVRRYSRVS